MWSSPLPFLNASQSQRRNQRVLDHGVQLIVVAAALVRVVRVASDSVPPRGWSGQAAPSSFHLDDVCFHLLLSLLVRCPSPQRE